MCKRKRLAGCIAGLLAIVLLLAACSGAETGTTTTAVPVTTTQAEATVATDPTADTPNETEMVIQTKYMQLRVPEANMEGITHREVLQDPIAMEIFALVSGETEMELFRIYFGDGTMGTLAGYITAGTEEIPVSYTVSEYTDFPNEEIKALYYQAMDVYTAVLNCIYESDNFSQSKYTEPVESGEAAMKYWSVELPENVTWEETVQQKLYRVDFYGTVRGQKTALYSIGLGEMEADYSIGTFLVDGEDRTVYVKIYDLPVTEQWTEEETSAGYRMMETVNDVVDAIMASEGFTAQ